MEALDFRIEAHNAQGQPFAWTTYTGPLDERGLGALHATVKTAIDLQKLGIFSDANVSIKPAGKK